MTCSVNHTVTEHTHSGKISHKICHDQVGVAIAVHDCCDEAPVLVYKYDIENNIVGYYCPKCKTCWDITLKKSGDIAAEVIQEHEAILSWQAYKIKVTSLDHQIGGDHYKKLKIEPWVIIDANKLNYYEGNILKYLLRQKDNRVEDLQKLIHHAEHEIERLQNESVIK